MKGPFGDVILQKFADGSSFVVKKVDLHKLKSDKISKLLNDIIAIANIFIQKNSRNSEFFSKILKLFLVG
jgi:hypothetical protein